jgi:hypothetical protein
MMRAGYLDGDVKKTEYHHGKAALPAGLAARP